MEEIKRRRLAQDKIDEIVLSLIAGQSLRGAAHKIEVTKKTVQRHKPDTPTLKNLRRLYKSGRLLIVPLAK